METKLKYRLSKWEKALVFQVLEMDERFRADKEFNANTKEFRAKNGCEIKSCFNPEIQQDCLFLRGLLTNKDALVSALQFNSNADRDAHFDRIQEALADWAANWEGWGDEDQEADLEGLIKGVCAYCDKADPPNEPHAICFSGDFSGAVTTKRNITLVTFNSKIDFIRQAKEILQKFPKQPQEIEPNVYILT